MAEQHIDHYEKTKQVFDNIALENRGFYDMHPGDSGYTFWQRRIILIVYRFIDKYVIRDSEVQTILDVGCGNGDLVINLYKRYFHLEKITGCDFSKNMVRLANEKNILSKKINFIQEDILSLSFTDRVYDLTICINVLHHIKSTNLSKALTELSRITGRYLLLEIKDSENFYNKYVSNKTAYGLKLYPVNRKFIIKTISDSGFQLLHKKGIFGMDLISPRIVLLFKRIS